MPSTKRFILFTAFITFSAISIFLLSIVSKVRKTTTSETCVRGKQTYQQPTADADIRQAGDVSGLGKTVRMGIIAVVVIASSVLLGRVAGESIEPVERIVQVCQVEKGTPIEHVSSPTYTVATDSLNTPWVKMAKEAAAALNMGHYAPILKILLNVQRDGPRDVREGRKLAAGMAQEIFTWQSQAEAEQKNPRMRAKIRLTLALLCIAQRVYQQGLIEDGDEIHRSAFTHH